MLLIYIVLIVMLCYQMFQNFKILYNVLNSADSDQILEEMYYKNSPYFENTVNMSTEVLIKILLTPSPSLSDT